MNPDVLLKSAIITKGILTAHAIRVKREARKLVTKEVAKRVHLKQVERLENAIEETMEDFFIRQIHSASRELRKQDEVPLASQIFHPAEWDAELINRMFPVLAQGMIEGADAQLQMMGVKIKSTKASTATEYLQSLTDVDLAEMEFLIPTGIAGEMSTYNLRIATEFPQSLKDAIEERLQETFSQDYWAKVNETTLGDIDQYLKKGIADGWSIERMAKEMSHSLLEEGEYALIRGRRIARTESGNALNGARSAAIDSVISETGSEGQIQKVWLSVLGTTTRETHANLDGVPADKTGRWLLGGVWCRWPGDVVLSAEERINCQCSINTEFGLQDAYAQQLIDEYQQRYDEWLIAEQGKTYTGDKVFCPTGPGGGVDPTCSPGKSGFGKIRVKDPSGKYIPGVVGKQSGIDTSKWNKDSVDSQWALKKINTLEKLAAEGKWSEFNKNLSKPKTEYNKLSKQQKGIIDAQNNLLKLHGQQVAKSAPPLKEWKKIGGQLGTEKGGLYEYDGKKYYVKTPDDEGRAHNEVLALKLYELAGAGAVTGHLVDIDGKKAVATEWMEGSEKVKWTAGDKVAAAEDFAVHAWLNNRDAVGAGTENPMDNIRLSADGHLKLVDAGGSLDYKGMGGSGKKDFGDTAVEFSTFRNPDVNPTMAKVFGDMTPNQLAASAEKLKNVTNQQVWDIVEKFHGGTKSEKVAMASTLIARRDKIIDMGDSYKSVAELGHGNTPVQSAAKVGADTPLGKAISGSPASVPPPPQIKAKSMAYLQTKLDAIHQAAKNGDTKAIEKIKTIENSKDTYYQKVHQYKQEVLTSLKSGGKVSEDHVVPKPTKQEIKIDYTQFSPVPNFSSKNATNVVENTKAANTALELAKKGDLDGLKAMTVPASPKLQQWHKELVTNVSNQLNPPPPPKKLSESYKQISEKVTNVKGEGLKKVGYWVVAGDVGGIPEGGGTGQYLDYSQSTALWSKGQAAYEKSGAKQNLEHYTGSGSDPMNEALRTGNFNSEYGQKALKAANAIMKKGVEIPEGSRLERSHSAIDASELKAGSVVVDRGLLSTSTTERHGSTRWIMTVGPGVKGMPARSFSTYKNENEVILPPNQRILVTHVETKKGMFGNQTTTAHAIILPTLDSQCCPP